jgi:LysM repeat protein
MRKFAFVLLLAVAGTGVSVGSTHAADQATAQPQKHKVAAGESLSSIATENKLDNWRPLWNANTQLQNPDMLNVDEELTIPNGPTTDRPLPAGYGEPVVAQAAAPVAVAAAPVASGYKPAATKRFVGGSAASGDIFGRIRMRESGGNYAANTGNGYYGAYQYDIGTWNHYGGYARADLAPPAVQDAKAQETYARRGCSPWPNTCY